MNYFHEFTFERIKSQFADRRYLNSIIAPATKMRRHKCSPLGENLFINSDLWGIISLLLRALFHDLEPYFVRSDECFLGRWYCSVLYNQQQERLNSSMRDVTNVIGIQVSTPTKCLKMEQKQSRDKPKRYFHALRLKRILMTFFLSPIWCFPIPNRTKMPDERQVKKIRK